MCVFGYLIMGGKEIKCMKAYAGVKDNECVIECLEVDIMCSKTELNELITALIKFQEEINTYVQANKFCSELGITHMHYQDTVSEWEDGDTDVVFYVDMDK